MCIIKKKFVVLIVLFLLCFHRYLECISPCTYAATYEEEYASTSTDISNRGVHGCMKKNCYIWAIYCSFWYKLENVHKTYCDGVKFRHALTKFSEQIFKLIGPKKGNVWKKFSEQIRLKQRTISRTHVHLCCFNNDSDLLISYCWIS